MHGPICTVVWEGEGRETFAYPDYNSQEVKHGLIKLDFILAFRRMAKRGNRRQKGHPIFISAAESEAAVVFKGISGPYGLKERIGGVMGGNL
jgi:hypothetical protein